MNKDILTFNDRTTVDIESGSSLSAITVVSGNKENFITIWNRFSKENLSSIKISNSENVDIATYSNLILVNETSEVLEDGSIKTAFNLREMTESEIAISRLQARVDELEKGQTVYADAIDELATVVAAESEG